ncbi:MAG: NAD(+) synthase [Clostridia bacterium]|nr:NAD(+) synthase [Clostridia bacterium]
MHDGFIRVAAATPEIRVADCQYNEAEILKLMRQAKQDSVQVVIFPELSLTGYTCADLFFSQTLQQAARASLSRLVKASQTIAGLFAVGLPLAADSALYNVAAVFQNGQLLGFVPKQQLPDYGEFNETRYFTPGPDQDDCLFDGMTVPLGTDLLFRSRELPDICLGFEICEDLWSPQPPSVRLALAGATIIGNLSASNEIVAKADYRRLLVRSQSGRLICAYCYASAGQGESTTDLVFSGHNLIYENGARLAESPLFSTGLLCADIDVQQLSQDRRRHKIISGQSAERPRVREIGFSTPPVTLSLMRTVGKQPFVPEDPTLLADHCREIIELQSRGLQKRLSHIHCQKTVLGLSGGLDSTLALLVTVHAFDALQLSRKDILSITMPGFGTTDRTYQNALKLAEGLGVTLREIPIRDAVLGHFKDIGHNPDQHDVTYENAQARERTQILMDLANQQQALVIGTGDLSELALGWATYNGDHMSMYAVNSSVPKTLISHLIRDLASRSDEPLRDVLSDILATPVSPELLPPENGQIAQKTESLVGPYRLHDFYLYYFVRFGFTPEKIERLAHIAFCDEYTAYEIRHWLRVFIRRFFSQQFKRSCLPDGPKVGRVALSPRGDWRMASDAESLSWLDQLPELDP